MNSSQSLATRLLAHLIPAFLLTFFALPATVVLPMTALHIGINYKLNLEDWTTKRGRDVLLASLRRAPDGSLFIAMTNVLKAQMMRNPEFKFAAFDPLTGGAISGSSPELVSAFDWTSRFEYLTTGFHLAGDANTKSRGMLRAVETPFGEMRMITYGAYFHWDDVLYQIFNYLTVDNIVVIFVETSMISIISFVVIRKCLVPLRNAADNLAVIDVDTLGRRIVAEGLPTETIPFVEAVNNAFERVRQGVARQQRFTANAAHELRTPITILRGHVERLDESSIKNKIFGDVIRLQTIVEQLLFLAQFRERKSMERQVIDLNAIVHSVTVDYAPIAISNHRDIQFEQSPRAVKVKSFSWAIQSIVGNLIENALRAEPEGGGIVVRISNDATIEVIDHGPGMDPSDRHMAFEPFWRKTSTSSGTGLGLAIVKELVEELGGAISVGATPGGGATFVFSLPLAEPVVEHDIDLYVEA